jgi:glutaminyl-peptide cyclotransferase
MKSIQLLLLFLTIAATLSCGNSNQSGTITQIAESSQPLIDYLNIESPANGQFLTPGNVNTISLKKLSNEAAFDSFRVFAAGQRLFSKNNLDLNLPWNTKGLAPGNKTISLEVFEKGNLVQNKTISVFLLSDIKPIQYTYRIIKTYPHDKQAYTQGLIYENGLLYESTGEYGQSSMRKVKLATGEVLSNVTVANVYFAEGLALFNNKFYQLTWREHTGFIYDKNTLRLLDKFSFPYSEGWGLTFDGKHFIMSNGSSTFYFINPADFSEAGCIEIVSNKKPYTYVNEMEYINGQVYANIYQTNEIIIFDPLTGKVLGEIDFSGLLKEEDKQPNLDVLNGIAFNPENKHLYITGKNWPKLFEVELVKK